MKRLVEFTLPIKGLKNGVHEYEFHIERTFFSEFEASPITEGGVDVHMVLDRHSDMLVFEFEIEGTVRAECDRCLAEIDLPIESFPQLLVKFSEDHHADAVEIRIRAELAGQAAFGHHP